MRTGSFKLFILAVVTSCCCCTLAEQHLTALVDRAIESATREMAEVAENRFAAGATTKKPYRSSKL